MSDCALGLHYDILANRRYSIYYLSTGTSYIYFVTVQHFFSCQNKDASFAVISSCLSSCNWFVSLWLTEQRKCVTPLFVRAYWTHIHTTIEIIKSVFPLKEIFWCYLSGGAPTTQTGFLGCLRALNINGITFDLNERAKMTPGMISGCPGHCSSESLCHNGGRCLENMNSYTCDCTHTPFTGSNCKTGEKVFRERVVDLEYVVLSKSS